MRKIVPVVDQVVRSGYCRCIVVAAAAGVEVGVWAAAALLCSASMKCLVTFG